MNLATYLLGPFVFLAGGIGVGLAFKSHPAATGLVVAITILIIGLIAFVVRKATRLSKDATPP